MGRGWRWHALGLLLLPTLILALGLPAQAAGPVGFDVQGPAPGTEALPPAADTAALVAAGAGWVRLEFDTRPFGGTDSPAFYQAYDQLVARYRAAGLQILGQVDAATEPGPQAAWQANNQEHAGGDGANDYISALAALAARLARHYQGQIQAYEVWDEPNCFAANPAPGVYTGCSYIYPSNFAALLAAVYTQTRDAGGGGVAIIAGGLRSADGPDACAAAGATYLSATYDEGVNVTGSFARVRAATGGHDPVAGIGQDIFISQHGPVTAHALDQALACVRSAYTAYGDTAATTWVTAFGWNSATIGVKAAGANLTTALAAFAASGHVQVALLSAVADAGPGVGWGLWHAGCPLAQPSCRKADYATFAAAADDVGRLADGTTDAALRALYAQGGGEAALGSPVAAGLGPWVHPGPAGLVQDLAGGAAAPALLVDGPAGSAVVAGALLAAFNGPGVAAACGFPLQAALPDGQGLRQELPTAP